MKNTIQVRSAIQVRNTECGVRSAGRGARRGAFTLIELLVVISIMAILAGFTLVVLGGISKHKYIAVATSELGQIETALDAYKAQYGVYPPSNGNITGTYAPPLTNSMYPQLYYELAGVTNTGTEYVTLDGGAHIRIADVQTAFGVGGFVNCWKGSGDEGTPSKNFLLGLKQNRIASVQVPGNLNLWITNLVTSVGGPDVRYTPLVVRDINPFRYVYPGIKKPESYDLWVQLVISGKTNLICNWSTTVLVNDPAP